MFPKVPHILLIRELLVLIKKNLLFASPRASTVYIFIYLYILSHLIYQPHIFFILLHKD